MMLEKEELNTCFSWLLLKRRHSLHLPSSSYSLVQTIARGSESNIFEARLHGRRLLPRSLFSTSEDIDKFHRELKLLCED
ncbi:hypothetical protein HPP92_021190 [Vanilla planifolia]|uniref:Uncharacterized protein n=1 Tax=Vanilla planifolia TaxID=51239 RepID=A0A835UGY4_VANPL|nr:hypothetical protein HPP92_021190 [Vanilla planifolia]